MSVLHSSVLSCFGRPGVHTGYWYVNFGHWFGHGLDKKEPRGVVVDGFGHARISGVLYGWGHEKSRRGYLATKQPAKVVTFITVCVCLHLASSKSYESGFW